MTDKWEALTTAEQVVAALEAGREVQAQVAKGKRWFWFYSGPPKKYIAQTIFAGRKYRALIEGAEP